MEKELLTLPERIASRTKNARGLCNYHARALGTETLIMSPWYCVRLRDPFPPQAVQTKPGALYAR